MQAEDTWLEWGRTFDRLGTVISDVRNPFGDIRRPGDALEKGKRYEVACSCDESHFYHIPLGVIFIGFGVKIGMRSSG